MNETPIYITLEEVANLSARLDELEDKINNCFRENNFNITIDLTNVKLPQSRFIATLIKATSQARRLGGDINLVNLNPSMRNNLVTFSPRTFLTIESTEHYALQDFGETFEAQDKFEISENVNMLASMTGSDDIPVNKNSVASDAQQNISACANLAQDKIRVPSQVDQLYEICDFVIERAEKAGFDLRERGKIKVTIYEACLNVIEHAYYSNPNHWLDVYVGYDEKNFVVIIQDWGESFEFDSSRQYDVEQAVKDRRTGGFGLHIIRRSVDEIYYVSDESDGNRLILMKKLF